MSDATQADAVQEKVHAIIAGQAMIDAADVKPESTPEELGLDSLALVEIVFAIEEEFGITVPYNANEPDQSEFSIATVRAVTEGVRKLVAEQA